MRTAKQLLSIYPRRSLQNHSGAIRIVSIGSALYFLQAFHFFSIAEAQTSPGLRPSVATSPSHSAVVSPADSASTTNPPQAGETWPAAAWVGSANRPSNGPQSNGPQSNSPQSNGTSGGYLTTANEAPAVQAASYTAPLASGVPADSTKPASLPDHTSDVFPAGANQQRSSIGQPPVVPDASPKVRHRIPAASASTPKNSTSNGSSSGVLRPLISIGSSLLIVLGAFFALVWVYRKSSNNALGGLPKEVVQVLGRTQLATRQNLVLIRFGSKLLLVSHAQGDTRTIGEIVDPLEVDQLAGLCESHSPNSLSNSFKSILSQGGA